MCKTEQTPMMPLPYPKTNVATKWHNRAVEDPDLAMRTVEFYETTDNGFDVVAWVYLQGTTISGECVPGKEILIQSILNDYCLIDDTPVWAHLEPVRWFNHLPRKYSNGYALNAFFVESQGPLTNLLTNSDRQTDLPS
jgi:hypothetical protein